MTNIVFMGDAGLPVTSSLIIAEGVNQPHKNVISLVRKYKERLEGFGRVEFKIQPFETTGGIQRREVAILNQEQATLLMTCLRNNDVVLDFKTALVAAFFEMAKKLREQKPLVPEIPSIPEGLPNFLDPAAAAIAWAEQTRARQALEEQIEVDKPKVEFANDIIGSASELVITPAGQSIGIAPRKFFDLMRRHNFMHKNQYRITEYARQMGYMKMKPRVLEDGVTITFQPVLLGKGLFKLYQLALEEGLIERNPQIEMSFK